VRKKEEFGRGLQTGAGFSMTDISEKKNWNNVLCLLVLNEYANH
jgi:hypothetical protein